MMSHPYRNNSNRSYRSYLPIWSVATFLLCLQVGNVVATTTSDTAININNNVETTTGGVVSLKLTPRHVEMDRRRRERKLIVEDDHVKKEEESSSSSIRRREEAMQVGALFEVSFCRRRIVRHSNIHGCFGFFPSCGLV